MEAEDMPNPHVSPTPPYARVEYVPTAAWSTLTNTNAFDDTRLYADAGLASMNSTETSNAQRQKPAPAAIAFEQRRMSFINVGSGTVLENSKAESGHRRDLSCSLPV
jgi:hypothetical protein